MSYDAMNISEASSVSHSGKARPSTRALVLAAAMSLGLTACETMKSTMDSINPFDDDEKAETTASSASSASEMPSDPRKQAVVRAGVEPVSPQSVDYYMDQQEAELRARLEGTGVTITRIGETILLSMPGSATFASGSSNVETKFYPVLDSVAVVLDEFNQTYVDVIGHTDSKGSKSFNQQLSEKRAKSVAKYLEANDVIRERVQADGMGEDEPIATNDTSEGRAKNRRVEIKLKPVT